MVDQSSLPNTIEPQVRPEDFVDPNFDAEAFVRHVVTESIGDGDILSVKLKLLNLAERTTTQLKESVSQNYSKFIETAEEVRALEDDMYQLRSLLSQKKSILQSIKDFLIKEEVAISSRRSDTDQLNDSDRSREEHNDLAIVIQGFLEQAEFVGLIKSTPKQITIVLRGPVKISQSSYEDNVQFATQQQESYLVLLRSGHLLLLSGDEPASSSSKEVEVDASSLRNRVLNNVLDFRTCFVDDLESSEMVDHMFRICSKRTSNSVETLLVQTPTSEWKHKWLSAFAAISTGAESISTASVTMNPFDADDDTDDLFQEQRVNDRLFELDRCVSHHKFTEAAKHIELIRKLLKTQPNQPEKFLPMKTKLESLQRELVDRMNDEPLSLANRMLKETKVDRDSAGLDDLEDDFTSSSSSYAVSTIFRRNPEKCYIGLRSPRANVAILVGLGMYVDAADLFIAYKRIYIDRLIEIAPGFEYEINDQSPEIGGISVPTHCSEDESVDEVLKLAYSIIRFRDYANEQFVLEKLSDMDNSFFGAIAACLDEFKNSNDWVHQTTHTSASIAVSKLNVWLTDRLSVYAKKTVPSVEDIYTLLGRINESKQVLATIITRVQSLLSKCSSKLSRHSSVFAALESHLTHTIVETLKYLKNEMIGGLKTYSKIRGLWDNPRFRLKRQIDCQSLIECFRCLCVGFDRTLDAYRDCPCKLSTTIAVDDDDHVFEMSGLNMIGAIYLLNFFNVSQRIYVAEARQLMIEAAVEAIKLILKVHNNALIARQDSGEPNSNRFKSLIYANMRFCVDVTFKAYVEKQFVDITGTGSKYFAKLYQKLE